NSASLPTSDSASLPTSDTTTTTTTASSNSATTTSPITTPSPPPTSTFESVSQSLTTSDGDVITVNVTSTITSQLSSSSFSSTAAADNKDTKNTSSGLGPGGIAGLAAAGGVALLCVAGFFIWKCTRKRGGDFDDNEAIKWPELNAHGDGVATHAMPVHNTGRSGFDTGDDLSRAPSVANTYNASSTDFSSDDPYAVPPLPHLNPGQPYRDDPAAMNTAGYYDPYHGPVPQTFNEAHGPPPPEWAGNDAIPMTQMAGRASPGPQMAYGGAGRTPSPGPQQAYGQQAYPGPGRTPSPGPQQAYGRASPGPAQIYGRASPAPQAAYG
ncbi:hypothetical protein C8F01DRAFT_961815, partial [Mycena amicta]